MKNSILLLKFVFVSACLFAQPGTAFDAFNTKHGAPQNIDAYMSIAPTLIKLNDGGILNLGRSGNYDGKPHKGIVKVWPNGQVDDAFSFNQLEFLIGNDACQDDNNTIYVGVDRDGGTSDFLFVLNEDGSIVNSFGPANGPNDQVLRTVLADNQLYISGDFTAYAGVTQNKICRLNLDGSLDASFQSRFTGNDEVYGMLKLENNKLLVFGDFYTYDGNPAKGFVMLNADGSFYRGMTSNISVGLNAYELRDGRILAATASGSSLIDILNVIDTNLYLTDFLILPNSYDRLEEYTTNRLMPITQDDAGRIYVANLEYSNQFTGQSFPTRYNIFKFFESGLLDSSYHTELEQYNNLYVPSLLTLNDTSMHFSTNLASSALIDFPFHQLDTAGTLDNNMWTSAEAISKPLVTGDLLALDQDNLIVGGIFANYSGTGSASMAKLNATTGENDSNFVLNSSSSNLVYRMAKGPNGSFYVGGDHYLMNGSTNRGITRFLASGLPDPSFSSPLLANQTNRVMALATLPDGRILIGGLISQGTQAKKLQLLNADGTMDVNFNTLTAGPNDEVLDIDVIGQNEILVAGQFNSYNGTACSGLIKVDITGAQIPAFAPTFNGAVEEILITPTNHILCKGQFTTVNGISVNGFCRLNADGTLDNTLVLGSGFNDVVRDFIVQPDSMMVIVGDFTTYNGQAISYIIRLDHFGQVDPYFEVNQAQRPVYEIEMLSDQTALIRGLFQKFGDQYFNYTAKIELKCVAPETPTIDAASTYVCEGAYFDASVLGDLNGSLNWVWYKGSTTGAPYSTDDRISDSITQNTKFYVQAAAGCAAASDFDSIEVELRYPTEEVVYAEACSTYTWSATGEQLDSAGIYVAHIMNVQGCDSMVTLHLTMPNLDTLNFQVTQDSNLVQTQLIWPEYKWYNCNNNALLQITNVPYWEPDRSYNVRLQIVSADGACRRNADCFDFIKPTEPDVTGIGELSNSDFVLYPNPAATSIQLATTVQWERFEVCSQDGRVVQFGANPNGPILLEGLAPGMYFMKVYAENGSALKAFVVE